MLTSTPYTAELDIRLFGDLHVLCNRRSVQMRTGSTRQLLFAYLLLHRDTRLERKKVAHDLWPDERQPLRKLRDAKDRLSRTSFGPDCIIADETTIRWRSPDSYYLDLKVFESALLETRRALDHGDLEALRRSLTVANNCYQDELLVHLAGEWLDHIRTGLHRRFRIALEESIAAYQAADDLHTAIRFAEALICLDKFHETSYHILMRLYAQQGMVSAVDDTFRLLEKRLRQELSVQPSASSLSIYEGLTNGQHAVAPRYWIKNPKTSMSVPIGREVEWKTLNECWRQVKSGNSHCAMILGEAGIGKTYLVDAFLKQLTDNDVAIFRADCYGNDELNTFAPIYSWIRDLRVVECAGRLPRFMRGQLARFNADMLIDDPTLPTPEPVPPPQQKRLLYDSIAAAFSQIGSPLVFYLDDMQWLDSETAAWLRFVLRQTANHYPVFVLGTMRQGELATLDDAQAWAQVLKRDQNVTWLDLQRLDLEQTKTLIRSVEPTLPPAAMSALCDRTEGNPFFVLEFLHSGAMGWGKDRSVPQTIHQVVKERLRHLSVESTKLANFAAILGRNFDYRLLVHGLNMNEREIVRCLDELTQRHLVRDMGGNFYAFAHGIICDVVYNSLHTARRRLLHHRAAEAYQQQAGDRNTGFVGFHFEHAQQWSAAIDAYTSAGDTEFRIAAYDAASKHFKIAIELTSHFKDRTVAGRLEASLLLRLGAVTSMSRPMFESPSARYYEQAHRLARAAGSQEIAQAALRGLWEQTHNSNRLNEAAKLADKLMDTARSAENSAALAEAHWATGATAFYQGEFRRSINELTDCLVFLKKNGERLSATVFDTRLAVQLYLAAQHLLLGNLAESRKRIQTIDAAAEQLTNWMDIVYYRAHRLVYAYVCHDLDYAHLHTDAAMDAAEKMGIPIAILGCKTLGAWFASQTGQRFDDLQELEDFLLNPPNAESVGSTHFFGLLAQVNIRCGDFAKAKTLLDTGMQNMVTHGDEFMISVLLQERAHLLRCTNAPQIEIHTTFRSAIEVARRQEANYLALQVAVDYAEWLSTIGRMVDGADLLTPLMDAVDNMPNDFYVGRALSYLETASAPN